MVTKRDGGDGFLGGAVIAAIPEQGVGAEAGGAEVVAELADGAVHRGDFGEALTEHVTLEAGGVATGGVGRELYLAIRERRGEVVVEREIFGQGLIRLVG